jgi:hypothetical protein
MNACFDRRSFFGRCAAGGLALGSAGMTGLVRAADTDPAAQEPIFIGDRLEPAIDNYDMCCAPTVSRRSTPAPRGGRMLTRPVVFKGSRLVLNVSTAASGSVSCEICDVGGVAIDGFAGKDCVPIVGNRIEYPVSWKKAGDVSRLAGRPVRLRFTLQDADLFALRFQ